MHAGVAQRGSPVDQDVHSNLPRSSTISLRARQRQIARDPYTLGGVRDPTASQHVCFAVAPHLAWRGLKYHTFCTGRFLRVRPSPRPVSSESGNGVASVMTDASELRPPTTGDGSYCIYCTSNNNRLCVRVVCVRLVARALRRCTRHNTHRQGQGTPPSVRHPNSRANFRIRPPPPTPSLFCFS